MRYRNSSKKYLHPRIEKLIVILVLALCFLGSASLFSLLGDINRPLSDLDQDSTHDEGSDNMDSDDNEDSDYDVGDTPFVEFDW